MSQLQQAIAQLKQAIEKVETATSNGAILAGQQDLFGSGSKSGKASNVHLLTPKQVETKLNNMIGKVEALLEEG